MKALDAYRDLLKELDKYESPSFSIRDFNYFFPLAVSLWVDTNYKQFDLMQKEVDDLKTILANGHPLTFASDGKVDLPSDYRHILSLEVTMKFKKNMGVYRTNQLVKFFPERMKSSQKGFRMQNAYQRPNYKRLYFEMAGTKLILLFDSSVHELPNAANSLIDYVKEIPLLYLNPTAGSDYNQEANNTTLFFNTANTRNHVYYEIIRKCREVFLENIESPRYPAAVQQNLTT